MTSRENEFPEREALRNYETPERTRFQKVVILDRKMEALDGKIKQKQEQLKQASGIIQRFRIAKQIMQLKQKKSALYQQQRELLPDWR